jgi:hypothetical protein
MPTAPGAQAWARLSPAARAGQMQDYQVRVQDAVAACMKGRGFTYIPYVQPGQDDPYAGYDGAYVRQRAERAKYGFFLFAPYVYPGDPLVEQRTGGARPSVGTDPNTAVAAKLAPGRMKAYQAALNGSVAQGAPASAGGVPASARASAPAGRATSGAQPSAQPGAVRGCVQVGRAAAGPGPMPTLSVNDQKTVQRLFHDRIFNALNGYASCLAGKGYKVPGDPQQMLSTVYGTVAVKLDALKKKGAIGPASARSELNGEIKAALTDIDCGRTWYELHDQETRAMYPGIVG